VRTFSCLDGVGSELVEALLSNPALKLDAVAHSVGFGDLAAFRKGGEKGGRAGRRVGQMAGRG
jgi:hypothetical protein